MELLIQRPKSNLLFPLPVMGKPGISLPPISTPNYSSSFLLLSSVAKVPCLDHFEALLLGRRFQSPAQSQSLPRGTTRTAAALRRGLPPPPWTGPARAPAQNRRSRWQLESPGQSSSKTSVQTSHGHRLKPRQPFGTQKHLSAGCQFLTFTL